MDASIVYFARLKLVESNNKMRVSQKFPERGLNQLGGGNTPNKLSMIYFSFYQLKQQLPPDKFNLLLQKMPATLQQKINRFRNWQDAERSLAGNLLLLAGLQAIGHPNLTLADLAYTEFQKPYFNNGISFNISHSGSFIICAISESHRVGVDVEAIMPIPIEDFNNLFAPSEWEEVTGAQDKFRAFYTLWTRKEAFLKVIGCGLSQPLNEVVIVNNKIEWDKEEWFLHEIKLDAGHIAYICCDHDSPQIKMKEIYL